jgi:predicted PhzF superfamily epimerase YddE/YHI9
MRDALAVFVVDAFTARPSAGNPAGEAVTVLSGSLHAPPVPAPG